MSEKIDNTVDEWVATWAPHVLSSYERTLIIGNLRGFYSWLRRIDDAKHFAHCDHSGAEVIASGAANACPIWQAQEIQRLRDTLTKGREVLRQLVELANINRDGREMLRHLGNKFNDALSHNA